jgi:GTP-binding protein Era
MSDPLTSRFGTVALAGRPNAGKSTLLNALVGAPLAIISAKPQSTRLPVIGVRTEESAQMLFVDPPGLLDPEYPMQEAMLAEAVGALRRADLVLHLHPAPEAPAPPLATLVPADVPIPGSLLTVLTKGDLLRGPSPAQPGEHLLVSAATGDGLDALLAWCRARLPVRPFRCEPDDLSTQPVRFFVAEFVREAAFEHLGAELPYALAAEVDEFREGSTPVYIRVVLYTERESQKGMVVGKGGQMIKRIGSHARRRVEAFLGAPVYLDLWVKTLPKWRSESGALRRLGFQVPPSRSR